MIYPRSEAKWFAGRGAGLCLGARDWGGVELAKKVLYCTYQKKAVTLHGFGVLRFLDTQSINQHRKDNENSTDRIRQDGAYHRRGGAGTRARGGVHH